MSGYEPMDELSATLDSLEHSQERRITVPPPTRPAEDDSAVAAKPTRDSHQRTSRVDAQATPTSPKSAGRTRAAAPRSTSASGRASAPASTAPSQRALGGLGARRPTGPMKSITAALPEHVVDRVTSLRLDAAVDGQPFKLNELMSAALLGLPTKPSAVSALVDRYGAQCNYDRTSADDDFLSEKRLSTQITHDAARHVAAVVRAAYQEYGVRLSNKDLYAMALLKELSARV